MARLKKTTQVGVLMDYIKSTKSQLLTSENIAQKAKKTLLLGVEVKKE
jgi:hypothetical protein